MPQGQPKPPKVQTSLDSPVNGLLIGLPNNIWAGQLQRSRQTGSVSHVAFRTGSDTLGIAYKALYKVNANNWKKRNTFQIEDKYET